MLTGPHVYSCVTQLMQEAVGPLLVTVRQKGTLEMPVDDDEGSSTTPDTATVDESTFVAKAAREAVENATEETTREEEGDSRMPAPVYRPTVIPAEVTPATARQRAAGVEGDVPMTMAPLLHTVLGITTAPPPAPNGVPLPSRMVDRKLTGVNSSVDGSTDRRDTDSLPLPPATVPDTITKA